MEKHRYGFLLFFSVVISLGAVSFISCVIAENKKSKRKDLKVDRELCFLPESRAYGYGIAALICLVMAQIIGNLVICRNFCSREKINSSLKNRKHVMAQILLLFSWVTFGVCAALVSTATSMSRRQPYGGRLVGPRVLPGQRWCFCRCWGFVSGFRQFYARCCYPICKKTPESHRTNSKIARPDLNRECGRKTKG